MVRRMLIALMAVFSLVLLSFSCSKKSTDTSNSGGNNQPPPPVTSDIEYWLTTADQSALLQKQTAALLFGTSANNYLNIDVDTTQTYQSVDGFGYCLTGGSAYVINKLNATDKANLLKELFGNDPSSISVSYLRVSVGSSDLNFAPYSYDDMPVGQTDVNLDHFTLDSDRVNVIPVLKAIVSINPNIKILASPWSPPVWMKDNGSTVGGSLKPEYYSVYAQYLVKYIQQMKAEGITIDALTPQNEPLFAGNNPSLYMPADQQADFIKNNLGPAFQAANISTKIITYDHNCDRPDYPITVLNDAAARPFVNGSAFHLYAGDISALTQVHNAYPDKAVYFTEQYTGSDSKFADDLRWSVKNVVIGSMRNWSRNALEWNLASDPSYGPHTPGGCNTCKGALTIGNNTITRNVSYYIIGQASKFVPAGSVRIASNITGNFQSAAFKTPAGKKVLIVLNDGSGTDSFNIRFNGKWALTSLPAGAVATYIW